MKWFGLIPVQRNLSLGGSEMQGLPPVRLGWDAGFPCIVAEQERRKAHRQLAIGALRVSAYCNYNNYGREDVAAVTMLVPDFPESGTSRTMTTSSADRIGSVGGDGGGL